MYTGEPLGDLIRFGAAQQTISHRHHDWPINHVIHSRASSSRAHTEKRVGAMGRLGSGDFFIFIICVSIQWGPRIVGMAIEGDGSLRRTVESCIYKMT